MEYSVQDDMIPMATKESWDFLRRYPTFYAFNPNAKSYTRIDSREKIISKYNQYKIENVCVIFKEFSTGVLNYVDSDFSQRTKAKNSIEYFMKKAILKEGLEVCGMRLIYLDED